MQTRASADALRLQANGEETMKAMKNMTNQGGPNPGDKPKPDVRPPDEDPNPVREDPKPGEQPGNPNPDSFPNEIRATDANYRYKDGRQGVGEVPNPREVLEAAGSLNGQTPNRE